MKNIIAMNDVLFIIFFFKKISLHYLLHPQPCLGLGLLNNKHKPTKQTASDDPTDKYAYAKALNTPF